jgi:short subunit dehydrogenase-like uncharacterized protein
MSNSILLLGATGYTGARIARALTGLGVEVILAARNRARLDALASELRVPNPVRVIESLAQLDPLLAGARVVVNTIGPFLKYGLPVVEASVRQGVHYVDITGEQAFMQTVLERFHQPARERGLAILCAQAYEYAFGYCGSALLAETFGAPERIDIFYRSRGAGLSHGTAKSALGMMTATPFAWHNGHYAPMQRLRHPVPVQFPGETRTYYAAAIPGGESLFIPRNFPAVREVNTFLVLPRAPTWVGRLLFAGAPLRRLLQLPGALNALERALERFVPEADAERQERSQFTVWVRGTNPGGTYFCRMDGRDPYGTTARIAAQVAQWLVEGQARDCGVISTGRAFGSRALLDALGAYGVSYACTSS